MSNTNFASRCCLEQHSLKYVNKIVFGDAEVIQSSGNGRSLVIQTLRNMFDLLHDPIVIWWCQEFPK
jgi:DNA-binding transcriptional regulator/RsmH inhibitor MraZ